MSINRENHQAKRKFILMFQFVKRIFGTLEPRFLTRAYFIGSIFLAAFLIIILTSQEPFPNRGFTITLLVVNTLLFPFSKLVWNQCRAFLLGDTVIYYNAIFLMFMKYIINGFLWSFALFIAPVGIFYLWLKSRPV